LDQNSRISKVDGKKRNTIKMILDYYFKIARRGPQEGLPEILPNITSVTLGRIGGKWSPRINGRLVRGLHSGYEFALVSRAINGKVAHDMGYLAAWTLHGIPAQRTRQFRVEFSKPHDLQILIDGEIFDFSSVKKISAKRVSSNIKLYYD
jgi:hypothetical protein